MKLCSLDIRRSTGIRDGGVVGFSGFGGFLVSLGGSSGLPFCSSSGVATLISVTKLFGSTLGCSETIGTVSMMVLFDSRAKLTVGSGAFVFSMLSSKSSRVCRLKSSFSSSIMMMDDGWEDSVEIVTMLSSENLGAIVNGLLLRDLVKSTSSEEMLMLLTPFVFEKTGEA
uniref:(northern house mosquito) hypothetical protein n=1 Tax=Culex pipiens TaxID=7175 RepID=A0A8D8MRD4_CULPI